MNRSKPPRKKANLELRSREYLTPNEMELLITTAKQIGRYGYRDATMIMMAYRHGLRVSEIVSLRWEQIDLPGALLHVCRKKNGISTTHPLYGVEIRALRKLKRDHPQSPYVFLTERNGPLTDSTFRKIVARVGEKANMPFSIHPHMLRHSTGFKLVNEGHDLRAIQLYLGHKSIQNTLWYTELSSHRFKDFWKD